MGVIIYSVNLNTSPKLSYDMLECDIVMLQNYMLCFCNKRFCNKKGVLFVPDPIYFSAVIKQQLTQKEHYIFYVITLKSRLCFLVAKI